MKTILKAGAALAFLAVAAYGTQSNAEEPMSPSGAPVDQAGDLLEVGDNAVNGDELDGMSGRELLEPEALKQIAAPTNNNTSTQNDIELNGENSSLTTGFAQGTTGNNGGINTFMQNTGNNVNFQNSTVVQVIMGE